MVAPLDFTGSSQFPLDEVTAGWCITSVPYFILPEDTPSSVAYASPNVQSQLSYNLFPETPTGIALSQITYDAPQGITQDPYLSLQNTHDPTLLPQTTIDLSDNIYTAQRDEISRTGLSTVDLVQPRAVLPVILQPLPAPSLAPTLAPNWFEVPQRIYGHGRRRWDFKRSDPIPFSVNGLRGINMRDALRKNFTGLDGRDNLMLQNASQAISCRFLFPGYPPNTSYQISTFGWTKNRVRITRSKLAYEVARKLNQYLKSMAEHPMDGSTDKRWEIGEGFMHLENMFLTRLVSVSKGSFQPEIWVLDSAM